MISVVMTAYNAESFIWESIKSILLQSHSDLEIIVVDDGSTDRTREIAESFGDKRIHVVRSERVGRGVALNMGWHLAKGEYVAIQDADDVSHPKRLEKQHGMLQNMPPEWCGMCSRQITGSEIGQWEVRKYNLAEEIPSYAFCLRNPVSHTSLVIRRDALKTIGGYSETRSDLFDWDMVVRCAAMGWKFLCHREPLVAHRIHPGQFFEGRKRLRYAWHCAQMQCRAIRALRRNPLLAATIPPLFLYRALSRAL